MTAPNVRLVVAGQRPLRGRTRQVALLFVVILLIPVVLPVGMAASTLQVASDDFGVLAALNSALEQRAGDADSPEIGVMAMANMRDVEASMRKINSNDPLSEVDEGRTKVSMRNTTAPAPDHPRPYQLLMDTETQPLVSPII